MSIINEALKKTERTIQENAHPAAPSTKPKKAFFSYMLYGLILVIGIILSNYVFNLIRINTAAKQNLKKTSPTVTVLTNISLPSKTETKNEITSTSSPLNAEPEIKPKAEVNFVLNGIFFSGNDTYALINNQIVRNGDLIEGAKIIKITVKTVEIDNAGQIITLSTLR